MKRYQVILIVLLSMLTITAPTRAENVPQVLLIPREGASAHLELMLTDEVGVMRNLLEKAGFKVVVATVTGETIKGSDVTLIPNINLSEVKVGDYVGFLLSCMAAGIPGPPVSPEAVSIVKQAVREGKPVAAQHSAVIILAEAGVLVGKRYGSYMDLYPRIPSFKDAIYGGRGVVQDGKIITSAICPELKSVTGSPDNTAELTQTLITVLSQKTK